MAYPEDDKDDLQSWLSKQQSPDLTTAQPAAAGPGVWSKARDMMDKQSAMQYQPQDYGKFLGQQEAPPDRAGGDFKTILAMALDLFGNKGRGAGQLMQAGNQMADAKDAAWKKENGPQAQLQRQMAVKQMDNQDRASFNQDRSQLGAQIGQEVQLAGAQQAQGNADRTFEHTQERDMAGDVQHQMDQSQQADQFASGQGLTREQMAQNKALQEAQLRSSNANAAASRNQAAAFHADDNAQHLLDQDNQLNRDQDSFAQQRKLQEMQNQGARDKYGLEHPAPVLPEGYTATNPQLFSQSARSPQLLDDYTKKMSTFGKVNTAMNTIIDLQTKPGSAANKRAYDSAMKMLIGDKSKEGSTGALTGTEYERYLTDQPEYGELIGPGWRGIRDAATGQGNSAVNTLKQMQAQMAKGHTADLAPYGIAPSNFGQQQQSPQPQDLSAYSKRLKLVE